MMIIYLDVAKNLLDMWATKSMEEEQIEKLILIFRKSQFCDFPFNRGKAIHGTAKTKFILPRPDEYSTLFTTVMNACFCH